jgi:hypothetical protein
MECGDKGSGCIAWVLPAPVGTLTTSGPSSTPAAFTTASARLT